MKGEGGACEAVVTDGIRVEGEGGACEAVVTAGIRVKVEHVRLL